MRNPSTIEGHGNFVLPADMQGSVLQTRKSVYVRPIQGALRHWFSGCCGANLSRRR